MKNLIIASLLLISLSNCSIFDKSGQYKLEGKKYKDDTVSVQTAIDLALSSYLKGCSDKSKEIKEEGFFSRCQKRAVRHIKEDIVFILDQN